jgi:hypothetical protein
MLAYTNHGKTSAKRNEQWAKTNIEKKRSLYTEKNCFEISDNYCSTGDSRTEYVLILKTLFPQKPSNVSVTNSTSTIGLQLLSL